MKRQLLVTTGATVTFVALLQRVLDRGFMETALELKYENFVIQFGSSEESLKLVKELTNEYTTLERDESMNRYIGYFMGLKLIFVPFDVDFVTNYIQESSVVISHAGTGSIMDTLRGSQARLLVVVNTTLKDNHQLEIGRAFESLGVLKIANLDTMGDSLREVLHDNSQWSKLTPPLGILVEEVILEGLFEL